MMTENGREYSKGTWEAYQDGSLDASERAAFEARLRSEPELREQLEFGMRIDASLRRQFAPPEMTVPDVDALLSSPAQRRAGHSERHAERRPVSRYVGWMSIVAAAAVIAWAVVAWQMFWPASDEPVFVARELVDIYRDAVAGGFEPYYECHDEDRFVATFVSRQGLGLRLAPMPERQRMLGLSYPGGLSRDTTAVLCEVDRRPVMLFVDRMAADRVQLELAAQDGIGLHRRELQGLVIYEVTPLDDARMTDYLVIAPRRK